MNMNNYRATKPELAEAICQSVLRHHAYLSESLAALRTTASLLVGLCAPSAVGVMLYTVQSGQIAAGGIGAGLLMFSAICAGVVLMPTPWGSPGSLLALWYVKEDMSHLSEEEVADTTWQRLGEARTLSDSAERNSSRLQVKALWMKAAVLGALAAPIGSAVALTF